MRERVPHAAARLAEQVTALVQELRGVELYKVPGVSETLDWVAALAALDRRRAGHGRHRGNRRRRPQDARGSGNAQGDRLAELLGTAHAAERTARHPSVESDQPMSRSWTTCWCSAACCAALGFDVPVGSMLDLIDALTHVDIGDATTMSSTPAGRCWCVVTSSWPNSTSVFDAFWRDHWNPFAGRDGASARDGAARTALACRGCSELAAVRRLAEQRRCRRAPGRSGDANVERRDAHSPTRTSPNSPPRRSRVRVSRLTRLVWIPGERRTRRWIARPRPAPRSAARHRLSLRTGGDVVTLPRRRRRVAPAPAGAALRRQRLDGALLAHAAALCARASGGGTGRSRSFLFSTSLTRVTTHASRAGASTAPLPRCRRAVPDWSGGTRIGDALQQFHQRWSRRVLHHGPVVLLISDGWDRGEPDVLRDQIARLQRSCHRLIWLNPLIGTADYEPLTRGLQAALPFVDDFLPARTLADLGDLAIHLETAASRVRSRHTPHPTRWTSPARTISRPTRSASGNCSWTPQ